MDTTTATSGPSYVAIDDNDPALQGATGIQVMWKLSGEVACDTLADTIRYAGLDTSWLPSRPTPALAAKRAIDNAAHGSDKVVMRHPKGGWAIVHRGETDDRELALSTGCRVWVEGTRKEPVLFVTGPEGTEATQTRIRNAYDHYRRVFTTEDFGVWLPGLLLKHLEAVSLRESGGVYFVPATRTRMWARWSAVLRTVTNHRFYDDIRLMPTRGAIELVLDSVTAEVTRSIAEANAAMDDTKTARGFRSKQSQMDAVIAKIAVYEQLLGVSLAAVKDAANDAHQRAATSLLELEGAM